MSGKKMWFGIPTRHMQWVPAPQIDSEIQRLRHVETSEYENGGGDVSRSRQYQMQYDFNFLGKAHEMEGVDVFNRFASGFYGDGLIHLAHPANFETNLCPAAWASPALIEKGWRNIHTAIPAFANTAANTRRQPPRTATWTIDTAANTPVRKLTLVIPPTHTLHLGASGSATGSGVVQVRPVNVGGTYDSTLNLTLLDATGATRMNTTFDGADYWAVEVYLTRTAATAATVTLTSMMAQLRPTGSTPTLPGDHYTGEGSTGLEFIDNAVVENYTYLYPPMKGLSTSLREVEAWR